MSIHPPSMYASTASLISLVAIMPNNETIVLVDCEAVNSCFGTIPLRYSWESEGLSTSKAEGIRLKIQNSQLNSYTIDGLEVDFMGFPCLCDSKTKVYWTGRTAMMSCYICDASPLDLAKHHCPKFKNIRRMTLQFGIGSLHIRLRAFDWLVKYAIHQDFKKRAIR